MQPACRKHSTHLQGANISTWNCTVQCSFEVYHNFYYDLYDDQVGVFSFTSLQSSWDYLYFVHSCAPCVQHTALEDVNSQIFQID